MQNTPFLTTRIGFFTTLNKEILKRTVQDFKSYLYLFVARCTDKESALKNKRKIKITTYQCIHKYQFTI